MESLEWDVAALKCFERLKDGQTEKPGSLKKLLPLSVTLQSLPVLHVTRFITRPGLSVQVLQTPCPFLSPKCWPLVSRSGGGGGEWFRGRLEFRQIHLIEVGFLDFRSHGEEGWIWNKELGSEGHMQENWPSHNNFIKFKRSTISLFAQYLVVPSLQLRSCPERRRLLNRRYVMYSWLFS